MIIEGTQKELDAMQEFHTGNRQSIRLPINTAWSMIF